MANEFNIIARPGGGNTLELLEQTPSTARFRLGAHGTEGGYIQMKITGMAANTDVYMRLSANPEWSPDGEPWRVHFQRKDDATNETAPRVEKFCCPTEDDGALIPISFNPCIKDIIIDLEVTGPNQATVLYIGAGIGSRQ